MSLNTETISLEEILASAENRRILFVGIGNVLRSDDGVGVYICRRIRESNQLSVLIAEVSIENYIGKINSLNPGILVLVDCVNLHESPGRFKLLDINDLEDLTYNTHNISLHRLGDFFPMQVHVLGIQPESLSFGEELTPQVKKSADEIVQLIHDYCANSI
jgi:hydrogenase 3 maturation protease